MRLFNPKTEATAFLIWRVASPAEWNLTAREIADQIGTSAKSVARVCHEKGWTSRLRSTKGQSAGQWMPDPEGITQGGVF